MTNPTNSMNGRVAMKSAVLTTTDDDIVVQNGISSDSDSSSECDTDKGDNAGYDKGCPSILILALEHAITARKTLEGESLNAKHWKVNPSKFFDRNHLYIRESSISSFNPSINSNERKPWMCFHFQLRKHRGVALPAVP